jgi:tRNA-specific 2-thiouridylase
VDASAFEHHLFSPQGRGHHAGQSAEVGGYACDDRVRFSIALDGATVLEAGFDAEGCGACTAAGSAAVSLVLGHSVFDAARVGPMEIAAELGGLSPGKLHAAELAADALARALGSAARQTAAPGGLENGAARTLVAMSGGVDSSVAALLCARDGDVAAVTLELWSDPENDGERSCCSASAVAQARALAHSLGLAHFTLDLRAEFRAGVVEPFITGYVSGETPNPCVGCNGHVRLDAMLELAERLGCATLATGHYARVSPEPEGPLLRAAADPAKDQTYMLAALSTDSLKRMRFPLGELTKPEVRRIAAEAELPVASKADSQDLCFLAGTDRAHFLARHGGIGDRVGSIVDAQGAVLGHHRGQHRFTVGQRRGIGVGGHVGGAPLYVLDKQADTNRVVVGPRGALETTRVAVHAAKLHRPGVRVNRVKLRYRSKPLAGRLLDGVPAGRHRRLEIELSEPVLGAAPGQLACLMDGELVVGWGTIGRL